MNGHLNNKRQEGKTGDVKERLITAGEVNEEGKEG
jgi:hypothetical protein